MAVVTIKSAAVTNSDATPQTLNKLTIARGRLRENVGTMEAVNTNSIGSIYPLVRVRSTDRISRVLLSCDAITTCAADFGVYRTAADGAAAVNAPFFASAQALTAALVNTDITHEADAADAGTGFGLQDVEQSLWQALGLTADPGIYYDICATLTAAAASNGTISLKVQYADGT